MVFAEQKMFMISFHGIPQSTEITGEHGQKFEIPRSLSWDPYGLRESTIHAGNYE